MFYLGKKIYSWKEHTNISKIAKLGFEMLLNMENIALQSSQILYTFVLRAESCYHIWAENGSNFRTQYTSSYTKFANFARLYFPHFTDFTTFRNQTLQFY
jgi:hypothetical protein